MAVTPLPFTNGFYTSASMPESAQRCVNLYPVVNEMPALSPEYLYGCPGIEQLAMSGTINHEGRGGHQMDGVPYFVSGGTLHKLVKSESAYSLVSLGSISGAARVSMADNGTQLLILVPGGNGYIYNRVTESLTQIADEGFTANGAPQFVAYIDGYFCCTTNTKKFILSALNDGLTWNALDYGAAESNPDDVVAPIVFKNQLFIAGGLTLEAFQNSGNVDFSFQRTGLFIQKGVYSPYSLVNAQDSFLFIGGSENESPAVWALVGNGVAKVSTLAIDFLLQRLTIAELSAIYAWVYAQNGSYFVGFALPDRTVVYDTTAKRWHERMSYMNPNQGPYRVSCLVQAYNEILCGDIHSGRIGRVDPDVYSEFGNTIIRSFTTQPFMNSQMAVFVPQMELTIESGMGNANTPEPMISMEVSKDGKKWSDPRLRLMGRMGDFMRRAIWRRNGRASRLLLFRFTTSAMIKVAILQLTATIEGGTK